MKKNIVSIIFLMIAHLSFAQQKMLSMEDAMLNARTILAPETLKQLQFIKGTADYVYLKKINGQDTWVKGNFKSNEETVYLTIAQFNEKLRAASLDTLATLPPIQFNNDSWIVNLKGQKLSFNPLNKDYKIVIDKNIASK